MRTYLILALFAACSSSSDHPDPGACPALTKPKTGGTMHDGFTEGSTDATWKAADSPHIVKGITFEDAT
ncbi:MAG TPA: hypothetical protein VFQ65_21245, partial [Kofleriaceae bacterium]|nr:hypothetical protein [Kofleriaceae bacterium]